MACLTKPALAALAPSTQSGCRRDRANVAYDTGHRGVVIAVLRDQPNVHLKPVDYLQRLTDLRHGQDHDLDAAVAAACLCTRRGLVLRAVRTAPRRRRPRLKAGPGADWDTFVDTR